MTDLSSFFKTDLVDDHVADDVNALIAAALRAEYANTETITATKELTDNDCQFQVITASGADRTVELAPEAITNHMTVIYNAGASNNVLVKDDSGATTFITLGADEWAMCIPISGETWEVIENRATLKSYFDTIYIAIGASGGLPTGYLTRGTIANNVSDANNDIDLAARKCRDSTDAVDISVAALTKRLDASWSVGNNGGFLDAGTKANSTWYHVYAIKRSDTGVTDYICSTNTTSPTMPANYDYYAKAYGQSFKTDGSGNIIAFLDTGAEILWKGGEVTDLNGGTSTTGALVTLTVPPGEKVEAIVDALVGAPAGGGALYVYDPDIGTTVAMVAMRSSVVGNLGARVSVSTNASAQVRYYVSASTSGYIYTQGWRYRRLQE